MDKKIGVYVSSVLFSDGGVVSHSLQAVLAISEEDAEKEICASLSKQGKTVINMSAPTHVDDVKRAVYEHVKDRIMSYNSGENSG